jgi:hypothetical protein
MLKRTHMPRVAWLVLLFTLVLVACGAPAPATTSTAATHGAATPVPILTDLHGPDDLKVLFNRDAGMPRIILLASPT